MKRRIFIELKMLLNRTNSVKDYINIAGPYGVTHIILFNKGSRDEFYNQSLYICGLQYYTRFMLN